jgi:sugar phosphate isomerase/epimerase
VGDLTLEEVLAFAAAESFACVELMCWPPGKADRRYAGVTHLDVEEWQVANADRIRALLDKHGLSVSALGYYPNPLHPDADHRRVVSAHLKKVMRAAASLGVSTVTTFIGRDKNKSIEDNWPLLREVWTDLLAVAEREKVRLAIENCPMLFSRDEWPGGNNLAISPSVWRALFDEFRGAPLGLNFDPSHLIWLHIDPVRAAREFGSRIFHVHAKDTRIDADGLYSEGVMGLGWHTPKIPGLGDVNWSQLFSVLTDSGYRGPVCIEVEDRAFEDSLESRQQALRQSKRFLEAYV